MIADGLGKDPGLRSHSPLNNNPAVQAYEVGDEMISVSEAMIQVAMGSLLLRRISH
jgi:hypothetical protein